MKHLTLEWSVARTCLAIFSLTDMTYIIIIIIIIIIIENDRQGKAGRERFTPSQSKDPRKKNEKEKTVEDK